MIVLMNVPTESVTLPRFLWVSGRFNRLPGIVIPSPDPPFVINSVDELRSTKMALIASYLGLVIGGREGCDKWVLFCFTSWYYFLYWWMTHYSLTISSILFSYNFVFSLQLLKIMIVFSQFRLFLVLCW